MCLIHLSSLIVDFRLIYVAESLHLDHSSLVLLVRADYFRFMNKGNFLQG
jgi:hypothetical protein